MDNSFLRLVKNDFTTARINENFLNSDVVNNKFVQMLPSETFLQITNCQEDIAFGGNILIELIDGCGNTQYTLTNGLDFFFEEITDKNGIRQIAFEFGLIQKDFGAKILFLKLTHTTSDKVWYSAPFLVTKYHYWETTRFDYKCEGYYKGISYDVANYFQSVRLLCYQNDIDAEVESSEYTELSGNKVSYKTTITDIAKGLFRFCNNFTFKRAVTMFNHDILFIDGYRTNNKPEVKKGERLQNSNFFALSYEWNPSEQYRKPVYQIFQGLEVVSRVPVNESIVNSADGLFNLTFNKKINLVSGITVELYENGTLVQTITPTASLNVLDVDFSAYTFTNARYDIVIAPNMIYSDINEYFQGYQYGEWYFNIVPTFVLNNVVVTNMPPSNVKYDFSFTTGNVFVDLFAEFGEADITGYQQTVQLLGTTSPQSMTILGDVLLYNRFRLYGIDGNGLTIYSNEFTI